MELVLPDICHKQAALDYRQEHFDHGEMMIHGDGGLDSAETYEGWLEGVKAAKHRGKPTEEFVPAVLYFGFADGKLVGTIQVRYKLNKRLTDTYGHIGYGVRPSERRKGYASKMLALALQKCPGLGVYQVLVCCDVQNIASAKTIIKNGGEPFLEFTEEDGTVVRQYRITL